MNALARIFGFDVIDPAATAKALADIRAREEAVDAAMALERSWHARMVADGLIREPEARTRCTDELDAAADTFSEAGMDDFAAMLRGDL